METNIHTECVVLNPPQSHFKSPVDREASCLDWFGGKKATLVTVSEEALLAKQQLNSAAVALSKSCSGTFVQELPSSRMP